MAKDDLVLVLGGARSGKSDFALGLAAEEPERVLFVATMAPGDEELRRRIAGHRAQRPRWDILEEPLAVPQRLQRLAAPYRTVLLDCLTLWVSNLLLAGRDVEPAVGALLGWHATSGARLIVVSNEVGSGVVPATALGRAFRDALGGANRAVAAHAGTVYYLVAGRALDLAAIAAAAVSPFHPEAFFADPDA